MPPRIFILVNDAHYFGNIEAEEGGDIKLEARGTKALLNSWQKGDIALVWLENTLKPAAYFTILDIQPRSDLVGTVDEYDEENERPHRVQLDSGPTIVCFVYVIYIIYHVNNKYNTHNYAFVIAKLESSRYFHTTFFVISIVSTSIILFVNIIFFLF